MTSTSEPPATPQGPTAPARRPLWRRLVRWTLLSLLVLVVLVALALVGLRLYFSDERLRGLAERLGSEKLGAKVELEELTLSFLSGVELRGFRIGPPSGFTQDVVRFERAALHWQAGALWDMAVVLPEVALEGLHVTLEENAGGRNVDALTRALQGPPAPQPPPSAAPPPQPPPPPAEPKPLQQPTLPLRVVVERLSVAHLAVSVLRPDLTLQLDEANLEGRFEGEGQALSLDLWLGLGERAASGKASRLVVRRAEPALDVESTQRFGLHVASTGFGDVSIASTYAGEATVRAPYLLPPLASGASLDAKLDLLGQRFTLASFTASLGKETRLSTALVATEILGAPAVQLGALTFVSDLGELSPYVETTQPGVSMRGRFEASLDPMQVPPDAAKQLGALSSVVRLRLTDVGAVAQGNRVTDLDAEASASLLSGVVALTATATMARAEAPNATAEGLRASLELGTPVLPWMDAAQDGTLTMSLSTSVRSAASAGNVAEGTRFGMDLEGPIGLLRGGRASGPLETRMKLDVQRAEAPAGGATGVHVGLDVRQWDLKADAADVTLVSHVESTTTTGATPLSVPDLRFSSKVVRRRDDVRADEVRFSVGDVFAVSGKAHVSDAMSKRPNVRVFTAVLEPMDIQKAIALLPPKLRPPFAVRGVLVASGEASGVVPYEELGARAAVPVVPANDPDPWGRMLAGYGRYLETWADTFAEGLPFTTRWRMEARDLAYDDGKNEVEGLNAATELRLERGAVEWRSNMTIAEVRKPMAARLVTAEMLLAMDHEAVTWSWSAEAGVLEQPALTRPLEKSSMKMSARYGLDDDLTGSFSVEAPDRGLRFAASASMTDVLEMAAARSWEQPGLPGLSLDSRWSMQLTSSEMAALTPGGAELAGSVASDGTFSIHAGVAAMAGAIAMKDLHVRAGTNEVEAMSGALPFDLQLAFDDRPGTTTVARGLNFAGGRVGLITGDAAAHKRPAYYERLREYRLAKGVTAKRIRSGPYVVEGFELDGRMSGGALLVDYLRMQVLGGDVVGNMAFAVREDRSLMGDMDFKASNIDASYFEQLQLTPGPSSELSADMHMGFVFAPSRRDFTFGMNLTRIGSQTFDRFLQMLDPEGKNEGVQRTRGQLNIGVGPIKAIRLNGVAMWIRYENLNMDIDARWVGGFPKEITFARYSLANWFDEKLQPTIDEKIAPALGWNDAR